MPTRHDDLIGAAEAKIAAILQALEAETGFLVESIEKHDIEVTHIESARPEFSCRVIITTRRLPGHLWGQTLELTGQYPSKASGDSPGSGGGGGGTWP